MDDAEREPDTPDTEDENDASRTATAEFRVPAKVNLTRPDIAVRRRPAEKTPTWYVQFPSPPEEPADSAEPPEPEDEPEAEAPQQDAEEKQPSDDDPTVTRIDRPAEKTRGRHASPRDDQSAEDEPAAERPADQPSAPRQAGTQPAPERPAGRDDAATSEPAPQRPAGQSNTSPQTGAPPRPQPGETEPRQRPPHSGHAAADHEPPPAEHPSASPRSGHPGHAQTGAPPQNRPDDVREPAQRPPHNGQGTTEQETPARGRPANHPGTSPRGGQPGSPQSGGPARERPRDSGEVARRPPRRDQPGTSPSGGQPGYPRTGGPARNGGDVARRSPYAGQDAAEREGPAAASPQGGSGGYPHSGTSARAAAPVRDGEAPARASGGPWAVAPAESRTDGAAVTRVERLPVAQGSGEYPTARSSGQWSVPWDGAAAQPAAPEAEAAGKKRGRRGLIMLAAVLVLVVGVVAGQLVRPVPEPTIGLAITSSHAFPGQAPVLPWPAAGQSVVYVEGLGTMGAAGGAAPTPTASVAKVMTAYVYLRDHPLAPGQQGPVLTVAPEAAAQIPMRRKREESLLGVTANQRLTQRKALEALLIISANDVAHELARWDSGNEQAFVAKMNAAAAELGMTGTRYTDPSGYDSGTVSTAADQVKLLRAAMDVPAFAEIVNNRAYVPDGGGAARPGGNFLLGRYGVVGGKTGYTDAAGGNFVFAARKSVGGVRTLIVGAVMGQRSPSAADAVSAAGRLVAAAEGALTAVTLAPKGARVALVDDGLGGSTPLRAAAPVTVVGWSGLTVAVGVTGDPPHRGADGERVGTVRAGAAAVPLRLGRELDEPSYLKRLIRLA